MVCESVGCKSVGCAAGAGGHVSSSGNCRFRLNDVSMSLGVSLLFMSSPPLVLLSASAAEIDV